ncbi:MAG: hypothetical protein CML61_12355 [Rhodobacteraceae bacterium]|nr:hypothetical protein [Paracoccaceae bacterium]|tara:strand:- start:647 stop:976 length:330 start_codon:yes stop_codon:yes gene_type:complete
MKLPEFTYIVFVQWPDRTEALTMEHGPDRSDAFDAAAEAFDKYGCDVRVECIERNDRGAAIGVSDATAVFFAERNIDPNRWAKCETCGHEDCQCDAAHDARQSEWGDAA